MIIDASAIIAILNEEPEAATFSRHIEERGGRVSAATFLEASIVAGPSRHRDLDEMLAEAGISVTPVDERQARAARAAYARYGKGSGSPSRLNFGDCFAYALAKVSGEELLFKGDDFTYTDVEPAG